MWAIEAAAEMAIAALQSSVDNIYAALREMMNEGEYGSEAGVKKGASATFGREITSDELKSIHCNYCNSDLVMKYLNQFQQIILCSNKNV